MGTVTSTSTGGQWDGKGGFWIVMVVLHICRSLCDGEGIMNWWCVSSKLNS